MELAFHEWGGALLRWLHVIAAMAWIGSSFFFMHLDAGLRPDPAIPAGKGGTAWHVHGGGFYEMRKYLVAPASLPAELTWHKWQSYATWLSGFFLLVWIYYAQAALFLVDPAIRPMEGSTAAAIGLGALLGGWVIYDLLCRSPIGRHENALALALLVLVLAACWGFAQVFSARGALLHTGALMATFMSGNVFRIIVPNQRKVVAALLAGETPNPRYGKEAKQRSVHNNYLTLPVVFLMLANHAPLMHNSAWLPVLVGLVGIAGVLVRLFFNRWHADPTRAQWWLWALAAALLALAAAISWQKAPGRAAMAEAARLHAAVSPAERAAIDGQALEIVGSRCVMCHAREPVWEGIGAAPKGVAFDTPDAIRRQHSAIALQSALTHAMPPGNITELSEADRLVLARGHLLRREAN